MYNNSVEGIVVGGRLTAEITGQKQTNATQPLARTSTIHIVHNLPYLPPLTREIHFPGFTIPDKMDRPAAMWECAGNILGITPRKMIRRTEETTRSPPSVIAGED